MDTPAFTPERKPTPAEQGRERGFAVKAKDRALTRRFDLYL
jgi:hypothetical protein